jgi:hypothetical protein
MTGSSDSNLKPDARLSEDDPFLHLHKMSTTAGLGSGDYVAINGTAIACILLGLGSAFVLFNWVVLLIIPFLGLIAGILAWKQIGRSNGTQTGREVAIVGLLLSLGFGGFYSASKVYADLQNRSDEEHIVANVHKLGDLIHDGKFSDAYALFDDDFHKKVSPAEFEAGWKLQIIKNPYLGNVRKIEWNKLLTFEVSPLDNSKQANGMMLLYARPEEPIRIHLSFRFVDGNWLIDQFPELFTQDAKKNDTVGPPRPK